ncbi:MAG: dihydropyrimidinase [Anaerolineae bacterium]|nr:dihydropyrimidinase [Anaerolineae bacterium]
MATIIKNGLIITDSESYQADILIEGEKISLIGKDLNTSGQHVIDATGKYVLPGGVDVHVHLDLPMFGTVSSDDHYTGMKAAAFGGTTSVIDFIPQDLSPLRANIEAWQAKAAPKAAVDYGFHMNITRLNEQVKKEMAVLPEEGITSVKVFTAYNGRLRLQDGEIFQVMRVARELGILTMMHAENGDVIDLLIAEALAQGKHSPEWHARTRPSWGAVESVLRGEALAAQTDAMLYIVHMNVAGEVDQLEYGRSKGLHVMGETCPQYLFFTEEDLKRPDGSKWICSPPMRAIEDNQRLWEGISKGSIQVVSTDHCPFYFNGAQPIEYEGKMVAIPGKELGKGDFTQIPNGLPGVGDRMPVMWSYGVNTGKLSMQQFVALHCTNPAKVFGLYPRKGAILPGSDADIAIWDPQKEVRYGVKVAQHRTDYNLYEDWMLKGFPETVLLRGEVIVNGKEWLGKPGKGQYLKRSLPKML